MITAFIDLVGYVYFRTYFLVLLCKNKKSSVAVFDLDNTLFDTWPLRTRYKNDKEVYSNVKPFYKILKLIENCHQTGYAIIFITARPYLYYFLTRRSINEHVPLGAATNLILVPSPKDKVFFVKKLAKKYTLVELYDDMSYNHEQGEVKLYYHVIEQIRSLNIRYFGFDYLRSLQQNENHY